MKETLNNYFILANVDKA